MDAYKKLKVSDLRDIAKSRRLRGWSRLRKDDLISFIIGNENYREKSLFGGRISFMRLSS